MKKYFVTISIVIASVIFGVFLFGGSKKTFYIKNNAPFLPAISFNQKIYQAEDRIGDLSNTIIPKVKIPENLTENFAGLLAKGIINESNKPKSAGLPAEPGLSMPDPNKIAEEFIKNGLKQANENILNIKKPGFKISNDNSSGAIESYLNEAQKIIKDNLNGQSLISILEEINKNNGRGLEKLLPIISAHEAAANQLEEKAVPSSLKNLIAEEINALRVTANILRALVNIESDPLGGLAAIKQFEVALVNWAELQKKFNIFIEKLNKTSR